MENNQKPKKQFRDYVVFSGMAFQMGITIAVFTFIGIWLDKKFPNDHSIYTVVFSLIGVFGALYSTIKQVLKYSDDQKND